MQSTHFEKILAIGPILPEWSEISSFVKSLEFLTFRYQIEFIDPLGEITADTSCQEFFINWRKKINQFLTRYEAFIGFSLGGVILQQCMDMLKVHNKLVILCSTPSFVSGALKKKLSHTINLISKVSLESAFAYVKSLYYYPNNMPYPPTEILNVELATLRLSRGLEFVLDTDSRPILENTNISYLHLIGEKSALVKPENIIMSKSGKLIVVPNAGMLILQDNLPYCVNPISKFLRVPLYEQT